MRLFNTKAEADAHEADYENVLKGIDKENIQNAYAGALSSPEQAIEIRKDTILKLIAECKLVED